MKNFIDLHSVSEYVEKALIDDLMGFPAVFAPADRIPGVDCGSNVFFRIAKAKKLDPQIFGETLLPKLKDARFTVSRGYLNFHDDTSLEWLVTPETITPTLQKIPEAFGMWAPDLEVLSKNSFAPVRLRYLLFFHALLALQQVDRVKLLDGDTAVELTKSNFFSEGVRLLSQGIRSASPQLIETVAESKRIFLHTSAAGLSKSLYKKFVALDNTEQSKVTFLTLDRVFFNGATVPWSEAMVETFASSETFIRNALWYFGSPLQGSEFDPYIVRSQENGNFHWWVEKLVRKGNELSLSQFFKKPTKIPTLPTSRSLYIALKFFDYYRTQAVQSGDLFSFTGFLQKVLFQQERLLNHPGTRHDLQQNLLNDELSYILPSIQGKLMEILKE